MCALRRPNLLVLAMTALCGCPSPTPGDGAFATGGGAVQDGGTIADSATNQADSTGSESDGSEVADGAIGDTTGSDGLQNDVLTTADASPTAGPCDGPQPGWYTKGIGGPEHERANAMAATGAGGAILVGETGSGGSNTDVYLLAVNAAGNKLWQRSWGGDKEDIGHDVIVLADGYAIAAQTRSKGAGNSDGWLIRTDTNGDIIWDRTYGGDTSDWARGIVATAAGGFVIAGVNRSINDSTEDGWMLLTDAKGEPLWEFAYGGSHIDELRDVVATASGYAAAGENWSKSSGGSGAWLLIVDGKGKELTSKVYDSGDKDWANALVAMADGGFALTGKASVKGNPKLWVIRTDKQGNVMWSSTHGGTQSEAGHGIAADATGGLFVAGETNSGTSGVDAWLLRFDAWGNLQWDGKYGGPGNQWGHGVIALGGTGALGATGALLAGRRWETSTASDVYLVRAGPWGHSACKLVGKCGSLQPGACDDNKPCTVDVCDSIDGCTHAPLTDGAACGSGKTCAGGQCL